MARKTERGAGWAIVGVSLAAILYLLFGKKSTAAAASSSGVGSASTTLAPISGGALLGLDPATGAPQYDSRVATSIPGNIIGPPLSSALDGVTDPSTYSCPLGYQLWRDVATGAYVCAQQGPGQSASDFASQVAAAEGGSIIS